MPNHFDLFQYKSVPIQEIYDPIFEEHHVRVLVKREDKVHPIISGNKWHKLRYNVLQAIQENHNQIISFGGAYSNHLHALAYAAEQSGMSSIGVVRGEKTEPLNSTLQFVIDHGMKIHYVNRQTYRKKNTESFINSLIKQYGRSYIVPEGGSNALAVKGCREMLNNVPMPFNVVCCACGTGATLAGLIVGLKADQRAIGFAVLKGGGFLIKDVERLSSRSDTNANQGWDVMLDYHMGGYAKVPSELKSFVLAFEEKHAIPLDPIYTGKMFYGLYDLIRKGHFKRGETILAIHSGGLQGRTSAMDSKT